MWIDWLLHRPRDIDQLLGKMLRYFMQIVREHTINTHLQQFAQPRKLVHRVRHHAITVAVQIAYEFRRHVLVMTMHRNRAELRKKSQMIVFRNADKQPHGQKR